MTHPGTTTDPHALHFGIAEQGKLFALRGRHREALGQYREALRLAAHAGAPQVVARHYFHCAVESLEHLSAWPDVIAMCAHALEAAPADNLSDFQKRDRAWLQERRGLAELMAGGTDAAKESLATAVALVGAEGAPLAAEVLGWVKSCYTVTPARLAEARRRHKSHIVRRDCVDPARAIAIPQPIPGGFP